MDSSGVGYRGVVAGFKGTHMKSQGKQNTVYRVGTMLLKRVYSFFKQSMLYKLIYIEYI